MTRRAAATTAPSGHRERIWRGARGTSTAAASSALYCNSLYSHTPTRKPPAGGLRLPPAAAARAGAPHVAELSCALREQLLRRHHLPQARRLVAPARPAAPAATIRAPPRPTCASGLRRRAQKHQGVHGAGGGPDRRAAARRARACAACGSRDAVALAAARRHGQGGHQHLGSQVPGRVPGHAEGALACGRGGAAPLREPCAAS